MMPRTMDLNSATLFSGVRSAPWRRILVAVIAVPIILVGILAMHVVVAAGDQAGPHSTISMTTEVFAGASEGTPPAAGAVSCHQFCGSPQDMNAMACILAILLSLLALAVIARLYGWLALRSLFPRALSAPLSWPIPRPPSLTVLSISRI
jgi:hypothetical protein